MLSLLSFQKLLNQYQYSFDYKYALKNVINSLSELLPGQDFSHLIDAIYVGGYDNGKMISALGEPEPYIGYLRNFIFGGYPVKQPWFDILPEIEANGRDKFYRYPQIPAIIFNDVTFPTYNTMVDLPNLQWSSLSTFDISLSFKTTDESGVILFSTGQINSRGKRQADGMSNMYMFVTELFYGKLYVKVR